MAKVKIEILCHNIMLDRKYLQGEVVDIDKKWVDMVNKADEGYGSPRIKVIPKPRKKAAPKKDAK